MGAELKDEDHKRYLREMRRRIRAVYRQKGKRRASQISPGEELRAIIRRHRSTLKELPNDIELWLVLFDEASAFWFAVWTMYHEKLENSADDRLVCLVALCGRAFQDLLSIRELIVGGFFVQSNVVARSFIETIDVMHLLNSRPEHAAEFKGICENDESSKFWHRNCSRDKIHKLVKQRWLWFFDGDEEVASTFHGVRKNYLDLLGMSSHPSFGASFSSFMDSARNDDANIFTNAMGSISQMSKFTIDLILWRVFEYGLLWSGPEISLYKARDELKERSVLCDYLEKGLTVLFSIVAMLGEKRSLDPFYPKFQTYWPRENFSD